MGDIIDYFEIGQKINRAIARGLTWGVKGGIWAGKAIYSRNKIEQGEAQYQDYETTMKNPPAPEMLRSDTRSGVFFGAQGGRYIRKSEEQDGHVLVIGGTGSGKSSCIAIPTLRAWHGRVFAIDIKGELYEQTRQYRPNIRVFNPLKEDSYGYDPYYFLRHSRNPAQEAKAIAQALIPMPPEVKEPFWIESAQNLFTGAILHLYHADFSFIETIKTIQKTPPKVLVEEIFQSDTEEAVYYVNNFIGIADNTLSGIASELSRNIVTIATDYSLVSALSKPSCITPADLEHGSDIYIQIPEYLLNQWNPFITLIVNQFLSYFERRAESNTTPILFLLDEFPRLGRMPAIQSGLATLRSRKVTIFLVIQNLAQISAIYGHDNTAVILGNTDFKAVLNATDPNTQKFLSALCGLYLKRMSHTGYQQPLPTDVHTGAAEQYTPIIQEAEFGTMRDIILISPYGANTAFCRVEKRPYYL